MREAAIRDASEMRSTVQKKSLLIQADFALITLPCRAFYL